MQYIATRRIPESRARKLTYSTRMLEAGDAFEVRKPVYGKVLIASRLAHPAGEPESPPVDEMALLREEYAEKFGRRPFNGWDAATLREKIAAA